MEATGHPADDQETDLMPLERLEDPAWLEAGLLAHRGFIESRARSS
jgi:hypothetical protein